MKREQTAVEWLVEQLTEIDHGCINKTFLQNSKLLAGRKLKELFTQSKQMEKEQIVKAAAIAFEDMFGSDGTNYGVKYYESKYGKAENGR